MMVDFIYQLEDQYLIGELWKRKIILHNVGEPHPNSWSPEYNKKISLLKQEGIFLETAFGLYLYHLSPGPLPAYLPTRTAPWASPGGWSLAAIAPSALLDLEPTGSYYRLGIASLHKLLSQYLIISLFLYMYTAYWFRLTGES